MTLRFRNARFVAATGAALIGVAAAAISLPSSAASHGVEGRANWLPLHEPTVVSVQAIAALGPTIVRANNRIVREVERESKTRVPHVPLADLGGAKAPASAVASSGSAANGFPGVDLVTQESSGTGSYSGTGGGLEPPDQALCVGNGFVMEGVNQAFRVYNTRAVPLTPPILLAQFFNELPGAIAGATSFLSDPKCLYDPATKRFFATSLEVDEANTGVFTRAHNLVAVSKTSDPTQEWYVYRFDITDDGQNGTPLHVTCPCLGDQPLIGLDANGFYITTNEFSDAEVVPIPPPPATQGPLTTVTSLPDFRNGQAQVYAISKKTLIHGNPGSVWQHDTAQDALEQQDAGTLGALWYSLQPSFSPPGDKTSVAAVGVEYFMSSLDFAKTGDNRVAVWALTNSASLDAATPDLHLQHTIITTRDPKDTYTYPKSASQKDGPRPIGDLCEPSPCSIETLNANDDRMNQVMLTNGHLWSGVNTLLPPINENGTGQETDPRTGIKYFDVVPQVRNGKLTATMAHDGYVNVPRESVLFPSIAASPKGPVVVGFTLSGVDYYPSTAWARLDGLRPTQAPVVHISGPGQGPEDGFSGYCLASFGLPLTNLGDQCTDGKARWGDYSASVVDESGCIWSAAEFISGIRRDSVAGDWSTFVTRVAPAGCSAPKLTPKEVIGGLNIAPCLPLFTGDAGTDDLQGLGVNRGQNPQMDVIKGDISLSKDHKFLVTTLTLRDLNKTMMTPAGLGNDYFMYWLFGEKQYFSEVFVDPTGTVTYSDGEFTTSGRSTRASDDTGSFNEGPNGTVVVNVPVDGVGGPKVKDILAQPYGETRVFYGDALVGGLTPAVDKAGPEYDYQLGQVCTASKPITKHPLPVPKTKVLGKHLSATGVPDKAALQLGAVLLALAAAVALRLRRSR
jgi:hypothetical protein